ncbi:hypothetical protein HG535_0A08410 [Zygotorulaspora mrakii]|uniref:Uncharacterized protein n=1 Tax=Zygotorulaspora mrakii TaxID=42260 RepID=A0A7H9AWZ5_ZYGMR|nr:uncharacterized protein HG535_0A08410 [Zygotorulaspora mrakii]QLG70895.1 hypothetical protein HG535_0A08410 [Zygotorulaspora mrakii]
MFETVFTCAPGELIHCFAATNGYIFLITSSLANTYEAKLCYANYERNKSLTRSNYPLHISRTSLKCEETDFVVRSIQIVSVPLVRKNVPLETKFHLVINTGDGIQVCSLEEIIANRPTGKINKWSHGNVHDSIQCSYSQGYKDGSIMTTYSTISGTFLCIKFDVASGCFQVLPSSNQITVCQDTIMDRVNSIAGLRNTAINYPRPSDEKLWTTLSNREAMVFSSFDNNFYSIIDGKLEIQSYYNIGEDAANNTLTWADFAIVKQYTTSSLRFFVANISNVGCLLYKRSNRGNWDLVKVLRRETGGLEKTSLVDCLIQLDSSHPNRFFVFSGSENGKLYRWEYDYKDDSIVDSNTYDTENTGLIHSISVVGSKKVFFLSNDNKSIKYLQLYY